MEKVKEIGIKELEAIKPKEKDFSKCMLCGAELPPNEDGSPRFRKFPELCDKCVWRNYKKKK